MISIIKICIAGVHGSGKTTLVEKLATEARKSGRSVCVVNEVVRDCPYPINRNTTSQAQEWIWHEQLRREIVAQNESLDLVICDRSLMDNIIYFKYMFDSENNWWLRNSPEYHAAKKQFDMLLEVTKEWMQTYDLIFRLPLDLDRLVGDGKRDVDVKFAKDIDAMFDEMLPLKDRRWDAETACADLV